MENPAMDTSGEREITPRVNAALLGAHTNRMVSFVGKVNQHSPGVVVFQSSDGTEVNVRYHNPSELHVGGVFEMQGRVMPDCSIEAERMTPYSDNFDLTVYNQFLNLAHGKFSSLFYA
mmetsp:Transcript_5972/g.6860  ORF Transcript_5972/g.6860 Transcript_5972/m.6860 type:complete len:118 (-) Transcript_5972:156-509(-)|eukprot:CAMPEP_0184022278 /NCGR_PEP_ID=MMETSP0954-20121128/10509_1 /TAXON_ID=627963 /ORGANISM="Aplanochytrium sp, Strain PBS07" /LENGTH=117 /DNA_ID=CAMNT_0026304619 /DNA_START=110 /DNA_END=466 /DNA_ORIENTATION=-